MKKLLAVILMGLMSCVLTIPAQAYIVDTGAPVVNMGGPSLNRYIGSNNDVEYEYYQWLAGRVTLGQAVTITSIESYFGGSASPGDVTISVYGDSDGVNVSDLKFRDDFYIGETLPGGWNGLYNQQLGLDAGTYWFAFEVRDPSLFGSYLSGISMVDNQPLEAYAWTADYFKSAYGSADHWNTSGVGPFAFRLDDGSENGPNAVPEPATMALLGMGLTGMALRRRKE